MLRAYLETQNYQVSEASSSNEALEILKNENINLAITDLHMPGDSGLDFLKSVRESSPNMPILIMTGDASIEVAVESLKIGANDFIPKPIDITKIHDQIKDALKGKNNRSPGSITKQETQTDDHEQVLGGYRIIRTIGSGGAGLVFLAQKQGDETAQKFALKILRRTHGTDKETKVRTERFIVEAMAASRISHPNIVKIVDYGVDQEENIPFICMEYIEGKSMEYYIEQNNEFDYRQKMEMILEVAEALSAIHSQNICHRDIKPGNILIDEDHHAKLADFGIARFPDSNLTMTHQLLGTPYYLSPEGFETAKVNYRSDIFSLGVVVYQFLLGELPFRGENLTNLAYQIRNQLPIRPKKIDKSFPIELEYILAKMLKKNADHRYDSCEAIIEDIHSYLNFKRKNVVSRIVRSLHSKDWR